MRSVQLTVSEKLMFIGVINKKRLLLPSDSLMIRCACVLIGYVSVQAYRHLGKHMSRG